MSDRILQWCTACLLAAVSFLSTGCFTANVPVATSEAVPLWGRWERSFEASLPPQGDVAVRVHLTSPSGRARAVDAFWDGGSLWRVRFMPDEAGAWSYRTEAAPFVAGLAEQQGTFVARRIQNAANPFLRHGAVRVADAGTHFAHADGTPFLWLVDTAWNGALRSSADDWTAYLQQRAAQRYSGIQFVTTQWRAATADADGQVAYTGFEDIQINPAFFRRLDLRVDAINDAGLLAVPVLLWALGDERQVPGRLPEDQAVRLARYLVARYGAHHVAWILGGDGNYLDDRAARWQRIGRAVFADDPPAPVLHHPQGMQWPFEALKEEPWLDVVGYQSGHGDDAATLAWIHSGPPANHWRTGSPRPVINLEPPYEDHIAYQSGQPHTAYTVRRALYWSLLNAPTAGVSYGAHGIWSWETSLSVPLEHEGSGQAKPWHEAVQLPGGADVQHVAEALSPLPWWQLRPSQELLQEQPGRNDPAAFVSVASTPDGTTVVAYLPVGGVVQLTPGALPDAQAEWFNPRDGTRRQAAESAAGHFSAPDGDDWVLVVTSPSTD